MSLYFYGSRVVELLVWIQPCSIIFSLSGCQNVVILQDFLQFLETDRLDCYVVDLFPFLHLFQVLHAVCVHEEDWALWFLLFALSHTLSIFSHLADLLDKCLSADDGQVLICDEHVKLWTSFCCREQVLRYVIDCRSAALKAHNLARVAHHAKHDLEGV